MRKINYPLIVSDFDNTLTNGDRTVPQKNMDAIREYVSAGGKFVICTGRMLRAIKPEAQRLGLDGLLVGCQGAVIADISTGKILYENGMAAEQAAKVCDLLEAKHLYVNAYSGDDMYVNMPADNEYLKRYETITGVIGQRVDDRTMAQFLRESGKTFQKVLTLVAPKERNDVFAYLQHEIGQDYDVTCSADMLVEVSPKGDDKGAAVKFVADYYHIPLEKTVAVGDHFNDISMIKMAGVGVAVGNAEEATKREADFVAVRNTEGAIAQVIETFGFVKE
jgi:hypothetical protein